VSKRIPYSENIIDIDQEKCTGCGNCVLICGGEVFEVKDKKAVALRMEQCLECGNCEIACPVNAIQFRVPGSGTGIVYECG